jgi:ribosomal protein L21E
VFNLEKFKVGDKVFVKINDNLTREEIFWNIQKA